MRYAGGRAAAQRRYRERHPDRVQARNRQTNAERRAAGPVGKTHAATCERCGDTFDYTHRGKPRRLCNPCRDHPHEWQNFRMTGPQAVAFRAAGRCSICGGTQPFGRGDWHIDHDRACCPGTRSCGACVRALLCGHCNAAIGMLRDDPDLMRRAALYVEDWRRLREHDRAPLVEQRTDDVP